jgi:mono/diheme cytochrome c family protein
MRTFVSSRRRLPAGALLLLFAACFSVVFLLAACDIPPRAVAKSGDPVARGAYLVQTGACADCHTPWKMGPNGPEPDASRSLSGHPESVGQLAVDVPAGWTMVTAGTGTAFAGPWGVSYAANLTPHETGLGVWSEELFASALRHGKHMGAGRPILPPMPWASYAQFSDEDVAAIWAYLQTLKPVENVVPDPTPPAVGS